MEERIQKIISAAGVTSRRAAEELIAEGRVRVNGQVVTELGTKADPSKDHIKVDGKLINPKQPPTYIMLNKPAGYVTTMSDPEGRPTVQDLLKGVKIRVYPVGRLDYNTEGLLLLTNDGDFAHLVTHPKHEFPKTYLAKIKGVLEDGAIAALEAGVFLKDGKTAPAKIKKIRKEEANSWLEITIHEGRKRQVRRMFDHMGHTVIRLKRVKTGGLTLGDLPEGRMRYLTPEEVGILRATAEKTDVSGQTVRVYKLETKKQKVEAREPQGPGPGVQGSGAREERIGAGSKTVVMRETGTGLRKNQMGRPEVRSSYARTSEPGFTPRTPSTRPPKAGRPSAADRPASSRPASGTYARKPDTGNPDWKTSRPRPTAGARPDSRPGYSRSSAPARGARDEGSSSRPGSFKPRSDRPYTPGARSTYDPAATGTYARSAAPGTPRSRPSASTSRPRPSAGARPDSRPGYSRSSAPARGARDEGRNTRPYSPGTRSASDRPSTGSYTRSAAPRTSSSRPSTGSRPDSRSGYSDGRSTRPSSFSSRPDRPYSPGTRSASARPATGTYTRSAAPRTASSRPSPGAFAGKAGARPRPNPGAWPSKGGAGGRVSGPRPNKSTHTGGGRGPARGPKGGGRSMGRR
ncbi:MAG: hypothetical protein A2X58_09215 [Nitrospirae bacterium GWC2_56_14]|nr:MAG: hypothetical protein A2X58_09215 [Nitrospirae bacterium GWC2_56_14]